ncbi:Clavaminate synthase-like protein [Annulohypoxylon maeteangense]|uniref:Clavaminate synthase-like protein n=1 Tax=Annulohypoxylon maeteangense TaxID=1927788 RepID=UPI0020084002|nr:Clavaminate synthase-like protein [Annulohypoxylon maeteangense]KAI0883271.1 Clavaminate synthase-like protein [Annulohypoxylon maeteangense]
MANMKPITHISRGFLSTRNQHVISGIPNLGHRLGRTTTHQFSTIQYGSAPWFKRCRVTTQMVSSNKRRLSNRSELEGVAEPVPTKEKPDMQIELNNDASVNVVRMSQKPQILSRHWLRDSCNCNICVDPDSGQKNFGTCDVPTNLPIAEASVTEDGGLDIVWENDFLSQGNHTSHYAAARIARDAKPKSIPTPRWVLWDKEIIEKDLLVVDYNEWMAGESGFISGLHRLHTHGLLFLRNVPQSEESVVSIANQIGNIQETFYGRTWDVRSKPNAENVAYTSSFLGLHQDLLYLSHSPRIQLLHCLENTCEGGDSLFSDGYRASSLVRIAKNSMLEHLSSRPLRYAYTKNGHYYQNFHPVLHETGLTVHWSPPFQSSDQELFIGRTSKTYLEWLKAATTFRHLLEDEQWVYQYKMKPGDCVLFDNMRVLHGRKQFDTATGGRHLKGTYIAREVYLSKMKCLSAQLMALEEGTTELPMMQAIKFNDKYKIWDKTLSIDELKTSEDGSNKPPITKYLIGRTKKGKSARL